MARSDPTVLVTRSDSTKSWLESKIFWMTLTRHWLEVLMTLTR